MGFNGYQLEFSVRRAGSSTRYVRSCSSCAPTCHMNLDSLVPAEDKLG